jgi:hypothetical protein
MLRKFAAASLVVSCLLAVGGSSLIIIRLLTGQRFYQIAALWCLLPFVWGIWAMLTPRSWFPRRLPAWGAILGAIAGVIGVFVIDVPLRMFGLSIPGALKLLGVVFAAVIYYALWIVVSRVYDSLAPNGAPATAPAKAA